MIVFLVDLQQLMVSWSSLGLAGGHELDTCIQRSSESSYTSTCAASTLFEEESIADVVVVAGCGGDATHRPEQWNKRLGKQCVQETTLFLFPFEPYECSLTYTVCTQLETYGADLTISHKTRYPQ